MIGQKVKVNDPKSFYHGRQAIVKNEDKFGDMIVLWVAVMSQTGNATYEFALTLNEVIMA